MAAGLLTSEAIVEAALTRVRSDGHEALSLRSLAGSLGVTAPALYDHFASKEALFRGVAEAGFEVMRKGFTSVQGHRAIDRCRARARAYIQFAQDEPELFRLMFLYRPASIRLAADNELPGASQAFDEGAVDVALAVAEGDLIERDSGHLNLTIWAAMHGVASVALLSPELAGDLSDDVIDAVFAGLAP